ncbi:MAG: glycine--tRNA ligase subunit beta [Clostridiales bacterium]|nr:glycine--tRNA ligase subunit beta [Clostridiales bacterium]
MRKESFLLEIGTEEIPARFMDPALKQLRERAAEELTANRLSFDDINVYGTPRRLALLVSGLAERQLDLSEKKKGPAVKAAFDADGDPTNAAKGFARSQGVEVANLFVEELDGTEYVFALREEPGRETTSVLPMLCQTLAKHLNFPKPMFWEHKDIRFARPIRWLTALYGSDEINFTFAGLTSGRETTGHRFLSPDRFVLADAADYLTVMEKLAVIVDPAKRRTIITDQVNAAAAQLGGQATLDEDLLDEVNYLVEFPKAVVGSFAAEYLEIPQEVLTTAMRAHQRYFPVFDGQGNILPHFITISNGTDDAFLKNVRAGNERVLRARLSDARFFFEEDCKKPLSEYVDQLDNIVFMEQLGSIRKKTDRVVRLAEALCGELNISGEIKEAAVRAAFLAKADLMTHMVYEFPELQGTMGMHYAALSGEKEAVSRAIEEHYAPRFAGDDPPASIAGAIVAVADKLDTMAACFGLGLIPSGSQDPYALRRSALGIVATLSAHGLAISLERLASLGLSALAGSLSRPDQDVATDLYDFFVQRVRFYFQEKGLRYDVIEAVLGAAVSDLPGFLARADALRNKVDTPEMTQILTPFTRVANLTREFAGGTIVPESFTTQAERDLYEAVTVAAAAVEKAAAHARFDEVFETLAPLSRPIDSFFSEVMVMVDDESIKTNRLSLLALVKEVFLTLGDLSKIVQEKK